MTSWTVQSTNTIHAASSRRGIYFLANDAVLELVVAFLNSIRAHNPSIPLCLIPFDESSEQLRRLEPIYGFSVYGDSESLAVCDRISEAFHGHRVGHYRKLAMWNGPFDEFVYIDVDTVIVRSIDAVFEHLMDFDIVTSHSHIEDIVRWVWKPSMWSQGTLSGEQIAFAANTGFIASKRHVLVLDDVLCRLPAALALREHMVLMCHEQPFLNFLIVTSGVRYTSLYFLARCLSSANVPHRISVEHWAGLRNARIEEGDIHPPAGRLPILLVHWAGCWAPTKWDKLRDVVRRILHDGRSIAPTQVRYALPYAQLWRHYRTMRRGAE